MHDANPSMSETLNGKMPQPFRLTICGISELDLHCATGVTHVLSILDPEWPEPAAFAAFAPHNRLGLRFNDVIEPAPDQLAPERHDVERLLEFGRELDAAPAAHLLIHCHAGVSRSTASAALILAQAQPALPAPAVFEQVTKIRPRAWPNLRILELGDALLDRGGELVAAAGAVYRGVLDRDPEFGEVISGAGRSREVAAAFSSPARPAPSR